MMMMMTDNNRDSDDAENESNVDVGDYDMDDDFIDNTDEVPLTREQLDFLRSDDQIRGFTNSDRGQNIREFQTPFDIEEAKRKKKGGRRTRRRRRKKRTRRRRKSRRKKRRKSRRTKRR